MLIYVCSFSSLVFYLNKMMMMMMISNNVLIKVAVWLSGNTLASINVVALRQTRLVLGWVTTDRLWTGKPSQYVTSQLGRLSLLPSVGR